MDLGLQPRDEPAKGPDSSLPGELYPLQVGAPESLDSRTKAMTPDLNPGSFAIMLKPTEG